MAAGMELRVTISGDEDWLRVMDAMSAADPALDRSKITRAVLEEWGQRRLREASLIVRFTGGNVDELESKRRAGG